MTIARDFPDTKRAAGVGWMIVPFWLLSMAAPMVIWIELNHYLDKWFVYKTAVLFLYWLTVGSIQSRLLRHHLRKHRLWIVITSVGGPLLIIGLLFADRSIHSLAGSMLLSLDTPAASVPEWARRASMSVLATVAAGLIGFAQSACFEGPRFARTVWVTSSAVAGFVAIWVGAFSGDAAGWWMNAMFPESTHPGFLFIHGDFWRDYVMYVGGATAFGLLTGVAMRRLLNHRMQRQAQALVGQFD